LRIVFDIILAILIELIRFLGYIFRRVRLEFVDAIVVAMLLLPS
jgi:hypothetical protein